MKVYTKTGDRGTTALIGGERVFKTDVRVEAYGTVDELSAFVALLADRLREDGALAREVDDLNRILSRLMSVEALLARGTTGCKQVAPLPEGAVAWLEGRIGGNAAVSMCHVCRTVCRRAERAALRVDAEHGVDAEVLAFLNRLSDYFYLLGRRLTAHFDAEEILWIP